MDPYIFSELVGATLGVTIIAYLIAYLTVKKRRNGFLSNPKKLISFLIIYFVALAINLVLGYENIYDNSLLNFLIVLGISYAVFFDMFSRYQIPITKKK
jgi:uncharacterized ion transporter superfamily protein YfcC